ncbi:MAG: ABC transporter permease [Candidatus Woesearchaeota archaeon]
MKLYRINALLLKYYYITINSLDRIFDIFYWPLIDLVIWGFASAYIRDISSYNLLSMFLGGIILWLFVWRSSQDIAVYILEDFWSRNLYHVFSSPIKISEQVISVILLGFFRALITFVVLIILAFFIYSFNLFTIPLYFIAISIVLLSLFGWAMGLFVTALIFIYGKRIQVLAWSVVWVIQPFSCVFYPLSALPGWAVPIAKVLPTTYIFESLRSVISNNTINYYWLLYALIIDIIFLLIMFLFLRFAFDRARTTGLLAKSD